VSNNVVKLGKERSAEGNVPLGVGLEK